MIGDPSFRITEKVTFGKQECLVNATSIKNQVFSYLSNTQNAFNIDILNNLKFYDNITWLKPLDLLSFISDVGQTMRVTEMLKRDSVQSRLSSQDGMSLAEFLYQSLQALDFKFLYENHDCNMQVCI